MHFLITNDDGIGAPGLELLNRAAQSFGTTTMIAPKYEQSGVSHRLTFDAPLKIEPLENDRYQVDGTPGDCVRIALARLNQSFDWVLSGVNDGANMGVEIYYSGTVAAAREATTLGTPAIAFSQYRKKYSAPFAWPDQLDRLKRILENLLKATPAHGGWINVNLPDSEPSDEFQIVHCAPDMSPLPNQYVESDGGWRMEFSYKNRPRIKGFDVDTCFTGNVAVTHHRIGES